MYHAWDSRVINVKSAYTYTQCSIFSLSVCPPFKVLLYIITLYTGSWLLLHSVDALTPSTLQAVCSLLVNFQQARRASSPYLQWRRDTIPLSYDLPGACFATLSNSHHKDPLPCSLLEYFQTFSITLPDQKVLLESLFVINEFITSHQLAKMLNNVCLAIEELFSDQIEENSDIKTTNTPFHLGIYKLKAIIALSRKHKTEMEALGILSAEDGDPNPLKMPSIVYSEISQSTRTSLKIRATSDENFSGPLTQQILEEFSLLLALKDTLLPALCLDSKEYQVIVTLLSELFPSCDLRGLLAHEAKVREGLAVKAASEANAEESARESRAASVLQNVIDESRPSESKF